MMSNEMVKEQLVARFGDQLRNISEPYGILTFETDAAINLKVMTFLKEDPALSFRFLNDLTVVHYPDRPGEEFCIVYFLQNIESGVRIRFKVYVPVTQPDVFTATSLFETANWLEREAYDFFGVNFVGHPNLIRIMNVDEMNYHPLRKEYPLEEQTRIDKDDAMFGRITHH